MPDDVAEHVARQFRNTRGLDSSIVELVAYKRFEVFAPDREHEPFGIK